MSKQQKIKTNTVGAVQGDVPILRVDERTPGGKATATRTVAYGEVTGHHHTIVGDVQVYEVEREIGGALFAGLEVVVAPGKPAQITHPEHWTVEMAPGIYFIPAPGAQQVEYDGANERRVLD